MAERAVDPTWFETFFDGEWLELLSPGHADEERTEKEVAFLAERVTLPPGASILDLACGSGRHSVALAQRGYAVTGVDLSAPSLERARAAAAELGVDARFVHRDMREIDFDAEFDAAINLWSSFGYFTASSDDQRVLANVARALRPGGAFVLEQVNGLAFLRRFRERHWEELADGTIHLEERGYDIATGRTEVTWTLVRPDGGRNELRHSLRVYTPAELFAMLARAGLEVEQTWGGYDGAELGLDSWRLIVLARRATSPAA